MSDKTPSSSEGMLFEKYHTDGYINDKTDFGEDIEKLRSSTGREDFPDGGFLRRVAHPTQNKKNSYAKSVSESSEAPVFFGELKRKYQKSPADAYTSYTQDPRKEAVSDNGARSDSYTDMSGSPDKALAFGGEYDRTDSAEAFFGNSKLFGKGSAKASTPVSEATGEDWSPASRDGVSRKEIADDAMDFASYYGTDDPGDATLREYEGFLKRKSRPRKTASDEPKSFYEAEAYTKYIDQKEETKQKKALATSLDTNAHEAGYHKFITKKARKAEMVAVAKELREESLLQKPDGRNPENEFAFIKRQTAPATEKEELQELMENEATRVIFEDMNKSDLAVELKTLNKKISGFKKREGRLVRRIEGAGEWDKLKPLCDYLNLSGELMQNYAECLRLCIGADSKFRKRKYSSLLDKQACDFNKYLRLWCALTSSSVAPISTSLSKELASGIPIPKIPKFSVPDKIGIRITRENRDDMHKEAMELLKDEREWKKRTGGVARIYGEREGDVYSNKGMKAHSKLDRDTVKSRIEYRTEKLEQVLLMDDFRLGRLTSKDASARRRIESMLKALKLGKRRAVRLAAKDNKRYFSAIAPKRTEKLKRGADTERMEELKARISSLILERDEVNQQLITLYTGRDVADRSSKGATQAKITKARKKGAAKGFKEQRRLYRKVKKMRIPPKQKEKIYELLNKKTDLLAYLFECKYRMKFARRGDPERRHYAREIRKTRREIKYATRDIDALTKRADRRSRKTPSPKIQLLWLGVLLLIAAAGFIAYLWFSGNLAWLTALLPTA